MSKRDVTYVQDRKLSQELIVNGCMCQRSYKQHTIVCFHTVTEVNSLNTVDQILLNCLMFD